MHLNRAIMNCVLAITIKFSATQKTENSLQTILAFDTVHLYQDITFRVLHLPVRTLDPQTLRSVNNTLVALAEKFSMIKSTKKWHLCVGYKPESRTWRLWRIRDRNTCPLRRGLPGIYGGIS